jgi:hypothetical protein
VQSQTSGAEHPEGEAKDFAVGGIMKRSLLAGAALAVFLSDFRLEHLQFLRPPWSMDRACQRRLRVRQLRRSVPLPLTV